MIGAANNYPYSGGSVLRCGTVGVTSIYIHAGFNEGMSLYI